MLEALKNNIFKKKKKELNVGNNHNYVLKRGYDCLT